MTTYIIRRLLTLLPTLFLIALTGFLLMDLPPGDYVTNFLRRESSAGNLSVYEQEAVLRERYDLDKPIVVRFFNWFGRFLRGDFGESFDLKRPVAEIIAERLPATLLVSICAFIFSWGIGIPLGIYSATHQYSKTDNTLTTLTFIGLGLPDFILALGFLVSAWLVSGQVLTGLQSTEFIGAPWSVAKFLDLLAHLWISVLAVVVTGVAFVMRVMRANLLNELGKNYVTALRARGLPERVVVYKHAVRNALHPLIMSLGQVLAFLVNGFTVTSIVLNLPTIQTVYLGATLQQDLFLAGAILVLIGFLVLLGTLLADILLAWLDPRIRFS
jgi:peptide/nickel transport system permease protein